MSRFDWLSGFLADLHDEHILVRRGSRRELAPAHLLEIDAEDWGRCARVASLAGYRWAGLWADQAADGFELFTLLEHQGDYLVLSTRLPADQPEVASLTPYFPAADRPERHTRDLLGLSFTDHPDPRRWCRHQGWAADRHPLREDFAADTPPPEQPVPADGDYPIAPIAGEGVCEIPVGPVHAGIIEPGHFRFQVVGETILAMEERLGYVHKGIEKIAVGRDAAGLIRLAARVSGDTTVAHAWAACQALERATLQPAPPRAEALRALLCERERVANHLGDIGAICNDVGFAFALAQCSRLREIWQRRNQALFGHRLLMDTLVPGGVANDLDTAAAETLRGDHAALRREIEPLFDLLLDQPSLEDRLLGTGRLLPATAAALGCTGHVGKASGQAFDLRAANPYPPYDRLPIEPVREEAGDVMARVKVRMDEIRRSLDWMDQLLDALPEGDIQRPFRARGPARGLGAVEGWRGEILVYLRLDDQGRVARYFPRDPSWHHWPALERIVMENIVPDFPVCNKSVNGSYSGQDL